MEAHQTRRHRVELLATTLLAVAAVAIAWSTYQSTQWRGQQAADNSRASAAVARPAARHGVAFVAEMTGELDLQAGLRPTRVV